MLGKDEAVTLAGLLEELAGRHPLDPLSAPALEAAGRLRHRAAARQGRAIWAGHWDPWARRDAGDSRDDVADNRDIRAGERDLRADDRDVDARDRHREADAADRVTRACEQRMRDLLWDAEVRDRAAARRAATMLLAGDDIERQQRQRDREMARIDLARRREDRRTIRKMLSQAREAREDAAQARYADTQDRMASHADRRAAQTDRRHAASDRLAARADRDQAVIECEERVPARD